MVDKGSHDFYHYLGRKQPTRKDGKLPAYWLNGTMQRYKNQRIEFAVKWPDKDGHDDVVVVGGVFCGFLKDRAGELLILLRRPSIDGRRYGGKKHLAEFPVCDISIIEEKQCSEFWKALLTQQVAYLQRSSILGHHVNP